MVLLVSYVCIYMLIVMCGEILESFVNLSRSQ